MAARANPRGATKKARKKKSGARKKGSKKATRRKAERKKKSARRKARRSDESPDHIAGKSRKTTRRSSRTESGKPGLELPVLLGFIREDSAAEATVSVQIDRGEVQAGDAIHVLGPDSDFYQRVEALIVAGENVRAARAGEVVSLRISRPVWANDAVHLLSR